LVFCFVQNEGGGALSSREKEQLKTKRVKRGVNPLLARSGVSGGGVLCQVRVSLKVGREGGDSGSGVRERGSQKGWSLILGLEGGEWREVCLSAMVWGGVTGCEPGARKKYQEVVFQPKNYGTEFFFLCKSHLDGKDRSS